jgi:alpha-beta hydrolase superfamily lysophospholipase
MKLLSIVIAGTLLLLSSTAFAVDEAVVEVHGRDDASIKFVYTRIDAPRAHIVFFPGGKGHMGVSKTLFGAVSFGNYKKDLSINTRKMLAEKGFSVAIVDTPSDRGPKMGGFRESEAYGKDVAAIIAHLKKDADVPVWLYGHSRGTVAAAAQTINLGPERVNGVILSASIAAGKRFDTYVPEMELERIRVPVLVMSAANDKCEEWTPKEAAEIIKAKLANSPNVRLVYPEGARDFGDKCKAESAHSYYGIQDKVTDLVAEFIKANTY